MYKNREIEKEEKWDSHTHGKRLRHGGGGGGSAKAADNVGSLTETAEEEVGSEGVRARWRDNLRHGGLGQDASEE